MMDWNEHGEILSGSCRTLTERERRMDCQLASALGTALAVIGPLTGQNFKEKGLKATQHDT